MVAMITREPNSRVHLMTVQAYSTFYPTRHTCQRRYPVENLRRVLFLHIKVHIMVVRTQQLSDLPPHYPHPSQHSEQQSRRRWVRLGRSEKKDGSGDIQSELKE
jgi:hypothetical protein